MGFDFEQMTRAFERVQDDFAADARPGRPLPTTERFLAAMGEVNKLFETLGSAFSFVKRDIEKKLATIARHLAADPEHYADLNDALEYETAHGLLEERNDEGLPSCARTLLRLMWALKFSDSLLEGLGQAFDPNSGLSYYNRSLKWAVARAYDAALAEHHSWTIRRTVKGACVLLPSKEMFMEKVGIDHNRREEYIQRLSVSMSPLVTRMYAHYDKHDLLALP